MYTGPREKMGIPWNIDISMVICCVFCAPSYPWDSAHFNHIYQAVKKHSNETHLTCRFTYLVEEWHIFQCCIKLCRHLLKINDDKNNANN